MTTDNQNAEPPTYRPLAPDEVPQVGDEVSVNWEDDWHPFDPGPAGAMAAGKYKDVKFRTTRPTAQPAMCAFHYMDADKCPCAQARKDRAELEQLRAEKRARTLTIAQNPDDQEPKTCLVCGGAEPCSHKFDSASVAGTPICDAEAYLAEASPHFKGTREELNEQHMAVTLKTAHSLESALAVANAGRDDAMAAVAQMRASRQEALDLVNGLRAERDALRKALEDVIGKEADNVAHDLDHGNFHRNSWWRKVLKARKLLTTKGGAK